ncbi:hypothetical protein EDB92DRAFT_1802142 [Lactarius akahatsu]|uniref:Uncharacterized protein n=1 Tax=Lactarius akahatsu TaxID=416441 RepID=A0AAD4Q5J8_9AGAM|nr:hypothetical protein EDB92DRAFT_1802142 [Lactarius akahatsu]
MSYDLYEEDHFLSPSSSTPKKSPPSRHTLSRNRSNTSLRGGASSLAHELAVALLPEPTAGSKLLAEEFGIEYDEGAEGIDGMPPHDSSVPSFAVSSDMDPSMALELDAAASGSSTPGVTDSDDTLDPTFHSSPAPRAPTRSQPEADAMALLSQNLESTEQFLAHLRHLDTDGPAPLALEALAADIISRLNETARDREEQVRELLKCEREFQRIATEVGGADALAGLDALEDPAPSSAPPSAPAPAPALEPVAEELSFSHEWEGRPRRRTPAPPRRRRRRARRSRTPSPSRPPPPLPASGTVVAIPHLVHLRTHTASLVSSLTALSEHAQVNGAATTDAGRKIRALKNKLGGWRTDWDSAERSRARIERWETGVDVEGARRVDGRAFVAEHLREFERVLFEANMKTQAIMAPS